MFNCRCHFFIGLSVVLINCVKEGLGDSTVRMPSSTHAVAREKRSNVSNRHVTENCCQENGLCADVNSHCFNCTCMCNEGFISSMEVMTSSMSGTLNRTCVAFAGNLPGKNCTYRSDCVEGLICQRKKCACPPPCEFSQSELTCDCGELERRNITGPIIIGIILTLMITGFWVRVIRSLIERYKAKRDRVRRIAEAEANVEISTLGAAYGTDHIIIQPAKSQQLARYVNHPSPARNHHTIAPASPLLPAFNAYGENINSFYQSSYFMTSPPPPYPGTPLMMSLPTYPSKEESSSNLNVPFCSMPQVHLSETEDAKDRQMNNETNFSSEANATYEQYPASPQSQHLLAKVDFLRPNRSARF